MKTKAIYLILTTACFILCVVIALFLESHLFIRGFSGDIVVTILIYFFLIIFVPVNPFRLGILVLLFSYSVEILQYFHFVDLIGLGKYKAARIILGTTFDLRDLLAYTIGVIIAYFTDTKLILKRAK